MSRRFALIAIVPAVVLLTAGPAWAHVTVAPESAPKGATDVEITFRVPNEESNSATTKVAVQLPADPPLVGVLAQPVSGWTVDVTTEHLAKPIQTDDGAVSDVVNTVTWTADNAASGVQPGDYEGFQILVGALPDTGDQVVFKAVQTYANGDVVSWIDPVTPDGPEAEHPTPIMKLTAGAANAGATPTTVATSGDKSAATGASVSNAKDDAKTAKTIGIVAIVFAVLALIGVAIAMMRRRPAS